jgi:hypothetical protein
MPVNNKANNTNILTAWTAYTPTFTGYGTVTSVQFWSRRVGDCLEVRGSWVCGTPTAVEARITIGYNGTSANVSSDATIVPSIRVAGNQGTSVSLETSAHCLIESGVSYLTSSSQASGRNGLSKALATVLYSASSTGKLHAKVPVTTWP